jgi:hypothetical protein
MLNNNSMTDLNEPAFPQPYPPQSFEKAIVFIDGSNLFNRLNDAKLRIDISIN